LDLPVGPGHRSVALNAWKLGFRSRRLGFGRPHFSQRVEDLGPGEVRHFFFRVGREVSELSVSIGGIEPGLPPGEQNPLFGDRVFLEAQNGRTSGGGLVISRVTRVDASFAIRPQSGFFRVAVAGSASNAGRIAARLDLDVTRTTRFRTHAARGRVAQGEIVEVEFDMPPGVERAIFELSWRNDWSHYPTDDLDMVVVDPSGGETSFASLDAPERGAVNDLESGIWTVRIEGFTVHGLHGRGEARWRLRITDPDGEPIQPPR
jgi:hypothetical protein